ncbi:hypothetical protein DIPPA_18222, partial [Diplonema papillatum]
QPGRGKRGASYQATMLSVLLLHGIGSLAACPSGLVEVGQVSNGVVCEDLINLNGSLQIVGGPNDGLVLPKRVYAQNMQPTYGGLNKTDVFTSPSDILGKKLLENGDPSFEEVLNAFLPIEIGFGSGNGYGGQHTFVSSRQTTLQAVFDHMGDVGLWAGYPRPPTVIGAVAPGEWNPATMKVSEGLIGGSLLVVHFVYVCNASLRWEMTAVAVDDNKGNHEQQVFFRFARILNGQMSKQIIYDTYEYNPAIVQPTTTEFYEAILAHYNYWTETWKTEGRMGLTIPEPVLHDQAVHSLIRDMVTRAEVVWPKYGLCGDPGGCNYGDPHNNGFPEIFVASMTAALEWGLFDYAKGVLNNYLNYYVRAGGGINYRGMEMALQGRIITCVALYYRFTGDTAPIVSYHDKIAGIANLLVSRIHTARTLPQNDTKYGMPIGNDEADLFNTDVGLNAGKTELPFYSIAAEAIRGLLEIGNIFVELGNATYGNQLLQEANTTWQDFNRSIRASFNGTCYPYVAGTNACADLGPIAGTNFKDEEPWRTFSEMFYADITDSSIVRSIYNWSANNRMMMRAGFVTGSAEGGCCGDQLMSFTAHGWGYGLLQNDMVPEYILNFFTCAAHTYTRGSWTAPEETSINAQYGGPYATPSQVSVPLFLKWMVLLDDVNNGVVWYGKAIPREWFEKADTTDAVAITNATSRFGRVAQINYHMNPTSVVITVALNTPPIGSYIRFRAPVGFSVQSAALVSPAAMPLIWQPASESVFFNTSYNGKLVQMKLQLSDKV